jgi:hypothetical protein
MKDMITDTIQTSLLALRASTIELLIRLSSNFEENSPSLVDTTNPSLNLYADLLER